MNAFNILTYRTLAFGILFAFLSLIPYGQSIAQITAFPFQEDFDDWNTCVSSNCNAMTCAPSNNWTQSQTDDADWYIYDNSSPSSETGPAADHTSGMGNYLYTENSGGCNGSDLDLESPWFDLSALGAAADWEVGFWYHMYGSNMGSLRFDYRVDDGNHVGPWQNFWSQSGDQGDQWFMLRQSLTAVMDSLVQFRFSATTGSGFRSDISIDDFFILPVYAQDARISSISQPAVGISTGNHPVSAEVQNMGLNPLSTVGLGWAVNGQTQSGVPVAFSPALQRDSISSTISLGNYTFPQGLHEVCVWTENPNGFSDPKQEDDTLCQFVCTPLNGTYSLGSGGDIESFSKMAYLLTHCGVSGPVVMQILPGTYYETIEIPEVSGSSATNTITIDGGDSSRVRLAGDGGPTVWLNGADHIHFTRMTISTSGSEHAYCVQLRDHAWSNSVTNCLIRMSQRSNYVDRIVGINASNSTASATTEGQNAFDFLLADCTIIGGDVSVHFEGSRNYPNTGNVFINNQLKGANNSGFSMDCQDSVIIRGNTITELSFRGAEAISCYNIVNFEISENIALQVPRYALFLRDYGYLPASVYTQRGKIVNNLFSTLNNDASSLYLHNMKQVDVYHNTVYATGSNSRALWINYFKDLDIRNNILVSEQGEAFYSYSSTTFNSNNVLDANLYFTSSSTSKFAYAGGNTYTDLAAWQTAEPTFNQQSAEADPVFTDPDTDLTPLSSAPDNAGDDSVGVTSDIWGVQRPASPSNSVDMGAIEFDAYQKDLALLGWHALPLASCGSTHQMYYLIIQNQGQQAISNFQLSAQLSGDLSQQRLLTYGDTLAFNEKDTLAFGPFNTYAGGQASLTALGVLSGDEKPSNNGLRGTTLHYTTETPSIDGGVYCSGDSAVFYGNSWGGAATYNWYDSKIASSPIVYGDNFVVPSVSTQSTYFVEYANKFDSLTTSFSGATGCYGGNMFDITAYNDISIHAWAGNLGTPAGDSDTVKIWYKQESYEGSETAPADWTLLGSVVVVSKGDGIPTYVDVGSTMTIPAGETYGIYFDAYTRYSVGKFPASNADLGISDGLGLCDFFDDIKSLRSWNGSVFYEKQACNSSRVSVTVSIPMADRLAQQNCSNCGEIRINYCQDEYGPLTPDEWVMQNSTYVSGSQMIWFEDNNGTQGPLYMGIGQQPPIPDLSRTGTQYYWVYQQLPTGCETPARRVRIRVKKTFTPTFSLTAPACGGGQIDLALEVSDPANKATAFTFYRENPEINPLATPVGSVTATAGRVDPGQYAVATVYQGDHSFWVQATVPNGCGGIASAQVNTPALASLAPVSSLTVNSGDPVNIQFVSAHASMILWLNLNNASIGQLGSIGLGDLTFTALNIASSPQTATFRAIAYNDNCAGEFRDFSITVNSGVGSRQASVNSLQLTVSRVNAHDVQVDWQIEYEFALSAIEIEKQVNDGEWEKIGQSDLLADSYIDRSGMGNVTKYRLKLLHADGRAIWSQEVEVTFDYYNSRRFTLYPNPSSGRFNLSAAGPLEGEWRYKLSDQLGRTILLGTLQGSETAFDISGLPTANYFLLLTSPEGKRYIERIAKN